VSEYIANPHLIRGYKYDIRVYACVTCLDPLRVSCAHQVYVYREGLIRFCSTKYSLNKENVTNKFAHLTNFSLNKHNPEYRNKNEELECGIQDVQLV
jgi:hypothetical protein